MPDQMHIEGSDINENDVITLRIAGSSEDFSWDSDNNRMSISLTGYTDSYLSMAKVLFNDVEWFTLDTSD